MKTYAWIGLKESDKRENENIRLYQHWQRVDNRPRWDVLFVWIGAAVLSMGFWAALVWLVTSHL